ncbi:AraC family transcriptional regulator [Ectobacillus ponti]|uniref:AraC family transcriptional regulator n=1 Tax=Ectobacillus ponti TaxID=2961894 RepID=A0AA41X722_9BACI|nr:AraC family transcriptional regulator [Ectobacillus ponti]MCP8970124.1 AraC family transcriptional regulator [Ectobacillus ponti]
MSEQLYIQQKVLTRLIESYTSRDGVHTTAVPSLSLIRRSDLTGPSHGVYTPSLCVIVQGRKEVLLAQERFTYDPAHYLVASVDLPATSQIVEATASNPYLALKLEFTPGQIFEVLQDFEAKASLKEPAKRAMFVSRIELPMLDAVIRLARLLDTPEDIPVFAPLFTKEILYRLLQGPHGNTLKQIATEGSSIYRIREVIEQIKKHYDRPIRIEELAEIARMSASSLHRHFKEVTAMSPIQFQKQLRLQEARRLLLSEATDAANVAFQVGYESPTQFSREYSRMFGFPPREDIKRLKAKLAESQKGKTLTGI